MEPSPEDVVPVVFELLVPLGKVLELAPVAVVVAPELALELTLDALPVEATGDDVSVVAERVDPPASELVSVPSVPSSIVIVHAVAPNNANQMAFIHGSLRPNAHLVKHTNPRSS